MKYAFWNNKGGVGKTFLCFAAASEYARQNPEARVVVIDMCPQANISEILLGGNGAGAEKLQALLDKPDGAQSVGGYYHQRILNPHDKTGTETDFLIEVKKFNANVPANLWLIAGDPSLELQVQTINNIAVQDIPAEAWKNVHSWIADLEGAAVKRFGGRECAFFIDCNPSFSAYTGQALLAANRLVVPCTADGSSARAIRNVSQLVYGFGVPKNYQAASFSAKAKIFHMTLPQLHLVPLNRSTTWKRKPAKAFRKMFANIKAAVERQRADSPDNFSRLPGDLFIEIPDAHTVAIVASHLGRPIGELKTGGYDLDGERTQINESSLRRYQRAITDLVQKL